MKDVWEVFMLCSSFFYLHELVLGNLTGMWNCATWQHSDLAYRRPPSSMRQYPSTLSFSHVFSRKDLLLWIFLLQVEFRHIETEKHFLVTTTINVSYSPITIVASWGLMCAGELKGLLSVQLNTQKIPKEEEGEGKKERKGRGKLEEEKERLKKFVSTTLKEICRLSSSDLTNTLDINHKSGTVLRSIQLWAWIQIFSALKIFSTKIGQLLESAPQTSQVHVKMRD